MRVAGQPLRRRCRDRRGVDPDHHRMVSPWLLTVLVGVMPVVVVVVVLLLLLLIVDAFEG